jgi:hypothetical protein
MADGVEDSATSEHPHDFEMYFDDASRGDLDMRHLPALGARVVRG